MTQRKDVRINGKTFKAHRLIMEKHLGRKLETWEVVHHINGDGMDNRLENLEIMDNFEHNSLHMMGNKRAATLDTEQVMEIKRLLKSTIRPDGFTTKHSCVDIGKIFGVTPQAISKIKFGHNWSEVKI